MPPEHARSFGGGISETTLNPVVLAALIIAVILILALPRRYVVAPLLAIGILVPLGQSVVIGGAHFYIARILVLAGMIRALSGGKYYLARGSIDRPFFAYNFCQAFASIILFGELAAVINQFGVLLDTAGFYLVLRFSIQDEEDVYQTIKYLAAIAAVISVAMCIEQARRVNIFSFIGGTVSAPEVRDGKIRSQGPFSHTLLAGTFGATLLPLFILAGKGRSAVVGTIGSIAATLMALTSNSSSPVLAYAGGLLAICLWPLRRKMRLIRWGFVAVLAGVALVMKAPVWMILNHIDLTGSSSGYQRAMVVDQFIRHFSDWWLIGVQDTGRWGWDLWDAQNQYVSTGESGGLAAFVFFIVMLKRCFGKLGDSRAAVAGDSKREWYLWLLGAALFAHAVGFFGVNYFDQSKFGFLALLAMISAATVPVAKLAGKPDAETTSKQGDWAWSELQSQGVGDDENLRRARVLSNT